MTKNSNQSADQKVISILIRLKEITALLQIDYLVFGSCGLQSYQEYFYRLPNDIDFIVRKTDLETFLEKCKESDYPILKEQGRHKVFIDDFPVHLIPETFSVITKPSLTVLGTVSFTPPMDSPIVNKVQLMNAKESIAIKVMNLEYCLMMELARKQDTNTFIALLFILNNPRLNVNKFLKLVMEHNFLFSRIKISIDLISKMLEKYEAISQPNKNNVSAIIALLTNKLQHRTA